MARSRSLVALAAAGAALAPLAVTGTPALAKPPVRHVICSKASTWIPFDYDGGCYLRFSTAVRRIAYAAFADAAAGSDQWSGNQVAPLDLAPTLGSMRCTRGGTAGLVKLNRWQAGMCSWTETWGHYGLGDHTDHEWSCEVTVVLRSGLNGKTRKKRGRVEMQWDVTGSPLQEVMVTGGEYPYCDKDPDDNFPTG